MFFQEKKPIRILFLSNTTSSNTGVVLHSFSGAPWPSLLCAAMLWVRGARRDCVPQRGLSAPWLPFPALRALPPLLRGARRAQLATQNSPFSWTHTNTHTHTRVLSVAYRCAWSDLTLQTFSAIMKQRLMMPHVLSDVPIRAAWYLSKFLLAWCQFQQSNIFSLCWFNSWFQLKQLCCLPFYFCFNWVHLHEVEPL